MSDLAQRQCTPIKKGTAGLSGRAAAALLKGLPGWTRRRGGIEREFTFENYYQTMAFVNAVAWIAHGQDHHPDMSVGYNRCTVRYSTHSVGGLSENDFICAAKVNELVG
jgi:4a-hydroxytetrahydrobiopterin dehydratase